MSELRDAILGAASAPRENAEEILEALFGVEQALKVLREAIERAAGPSEPEGGPCRHPEKFRVSVGSFTTVQILCQKCGEFL